MPPPPVSGAPWGLTGTCGFGADGGAVRQARAGSAGVAPKPFGEVVVVPAGEVLLVDDPGVLVGPVVVVVGGAVVVVGGVGQVTTSSVDTVAPSPQVWLTR